jgi:hypothetical protein
LCGSDDPHCPHPADWTLCKQAIDACRAQKWFLRRRDRRQKNFTRERRRLSERGSRRRRGQLRMGPVAVGSGLDQAAWFSRSVFRDGVGSIDVVVEGNELSKILSRQVVTPLWSHIVLAKIKWRRRADDAYQPFRQSEEGKRVSRTQTGTSGNTAPAAQAPQPQTPEQGQRSGSSSVADALQGHVRSSVTEEVIGGLQFSASVYSGANALESVNNSPPPGARVRTWSAP